MLKSIVNCGSNKEKKLNDQDVQDDAYTGAPMSLNRGLSTMLISDIPADGDPFVYWNATFMDRHGTGLGVPDFDTKAVAATLSEENDPDFWPKDELDKVSDDNMGWLAMSLQKGTAVRLSEDVLPICFPFHYTVPSRHSQSIDLEFTLPADLGTREKLIQRFVDKGKVILEITPEHIQKKFAGMYQFSDGACHFTPDMIVVSRADTKGAGMRMSAVLSNANHKDNVRTFTRSKCVRNGDNNDGFILPADTVETLQDQRKVVWAADPAVVGNLNYHRWKGVDIFAMEAELKATREGEFYLVKITSESNLTKIDNILDYFIISHLADWIARSCSPDGERIDPYNGHYRNREDFYTPQDHGSKFKVPITYADESLLMLKQFLDKARAICFTKPLRLELTPSLGISGLDSLVAEMSGGGKKFEWMLAANPRLYNFNITLTVFGVFHLSVPRGSSVLPQVMIVGRVPHSHGHFNSRVNDVKANPASFDAPFLMLGGTNGKMGSSGSSKFKSSY